MKHGFLHAFGIVTAAMLALGVTSASAQTTANGPYYATPSWDQTLPASTRFIVLLNFDSQAVLDRETGLVWQRSPSTTPTDWANASDFCTIVHAARRGWRLPTVQELGSLVDQTQSPALPSGHPFNNIIACVSGGPPPFQDLAFYWSASTSALGATEANVVLFADGEIGFNPKTDRRGYFWCVRGGMGVGNAP